MIRNFKTEYLTSHAYMWGEYFLYLNDHSQDRFRLTTESAIRVIKNMDFEVYYLYQFQNKPGVEPLHAIAIRLDFYFKSKKYIQQLEPAEKTP